MMHPAHLPPSDRLVVVFSDIEMGAGGPNDDFQRSEFLGELLLAYNEPPYRDIAIEVVFNGDTFDFLKTAIDGRYPVHIDEDVAIAKFERIAAAHGDFFDASREFLLHRGATRQIDFVVGNHDPEILFPAVQAAIRHRVGPPHLVGFPGFTLNIGDLHIEHGQQDDELFRVDASRPFVHFEGKEILDLSWGAVALLEVAMPLQPILYHADRLKPRQRVFELVPELRSLIVDSYWRYWTRDYWRDLITTSDPMKKMSWTMLREIAYRFQTADADLIVGNRYQDELLRSRRSRVYCLGHLHQAGWWGAAGRKILRTGTFRDEFMVEADGTVDGQLEKVYAEVYLKGGQTVRAGLIEVHGAPAPPGAAPATVFDLLPRITSVLGGVPNIEEAAQARADQEKREAKQGD